MKAKNFMRALNFICPIKNKTAKKWVVWSEKLEREMNLPSDPCKSAGKFREDILSVLSDIIQQYGVEIAAKVIATADVSACPFPQKMYDLAHHLAQDNSIEEVAQKKCDGKSEDGTLHTRTIRVNIKSEEIYSPQNYLWAATGNCYSFLLDMPIRKQVEKILIYHRLPYVSFPLSESLDALRTGAPMVLVTCHDYLEDKKTGKYRHVKELRWFRVPETFVDEEE